MDTICDLYEKIGELIKQKRIEKKICRKGLSNGICSIAHLSRIENGERCPNPIIILQICSRLGINSDMFFLNLYVDDIKRYNKYNLHFISEMLRHNYVYGTELSEKCYKLNASELSIYPTDMVCTNLVNGIKTFDFTSNINFLEKKYPHYTLNLQDNFTVLCEDNIHITNIYLLLHIFNSQSQKITQFAEKYFDYISKIEYSKHSKLSIYLESYVILALVNNDLKKYNDTLSLVDTGINKCKEYSIATLIPIFYYVKEEALYFLLNKETGIEYIKKAFNLHNEICPEYDEFFVPNIRLKQKKIEIDL